MIIIVVVTVVVVVTPTITGDIIKYPSYISFSTLAILPISSTSCDTVVSLPNGSPAKKVEQKNNKTTQKRIQASGQTIKSTMQNNKKKKQTKENKTHQKQHNKYLCVVIVVLVLSTHILVNQMQVHQKMVQG